MLLVLILHLGPMVKISSKVWGRKLWDRLFVCVLIEFIFYEFANSKFQGLFAASRRHEKKKKENMIQALINFFMFELMMSL